MPRKKSANVYPDICVKKIGYKRLKDPYPKGVWYARWQMKQPEKCMWGDWDGNYLDKSGVFLTSREKVDQLPSLETVCYGVPVFVSTDKSKVELWIQACRYARAWVIYRCGGIPRELAIRKRKLKTERWDIVKGWVPMSKKQLQAEKQKEIARVVRRYESLLREDL